MTASAMSFARDLPPADTDTLVLEDGTVVHCGAAVRVVPGARHVCSGRMNDTAVFIKLYHDPRRARVHFARERDGLRALTAARVPAPELLYAGPVRGDAAYVIVTRALTGTRSAHSLRDEAGDHPQRAALLRRLMLALAWLHRAGLVHGDPHLDNFLLSDERVYLLDGAEVRKASGERALRDNLALLCAQFMPEYDADARDAHAAYRQARGLVADSTETTRLLRAIRRRRERRLATRLGKCLRDCTAFGVLKDWRRRIVFDRKHCGPALRATIEQPGRLIPPDAELLKRGNTATVALVRFDDHAYVVKRYNMKSFGHRLSRAWRPTRAAHSWSSARLLSFFGVATPTPVALIEERIGPLRGRAWFVSEYVEGAFLREHLRDETIPFERRRQAAESAVALINALGNARITHGDLKANNILITADGAAVLTDLDALHRHRCTFFFRRRRARDLRRLLANWADRPDIQALFAGLKS